MYIKTVQLDGFKSYSQKVVVGPFDDHFTAITGLNGSGKSTIFDAICFVLGVTSLSKVRVNKLEELISKTQFANLSNPVKSAKVAIIFDNRNKDPSQCPLGQEGNDEIIVSRTIEYKKGDQEVVSKYHLNGRVTQKNVITDMFESIRVDINNPNFVIMQGRVTKVVNMKPKEILGMIEETVGAQAYQHKKEATMRAIQNSKRDLTLMETTYSDSVLPAYEDQKRAARTLQEFEDVERKVVEKQTVYDWNKYHTFKHSLKVAQEVHASLLLDEEADKQQRDKAKKEIEAMKKRQNKLQIRIRSELDVKKVREEMKNLQRNKDSTKRDFEASKKELAKANANVSKQEKEFQNETRLVDEQKYSQKALLEEIETKNKALEDANSKVEDLEKKEQSLLSGNILDDSGNVVNVQEKITDVQESMRNLEGIYTLDKTEWRKQNAVIEKKRREIDDAPTDEQIEHEILMARRKFNTLDQELKEAGVTSADSSNVERLKQEAEKELHQNQWRINNLENKHNLSSFYHEVPASFNLPVTSIAGFVYELFTVEDPEEYAVALESGCSGNFKKVVVDSSSTSRLLIERGNLKQRTTFLPLESLRPTKIPNTTSLDTHLGVGNYKRAIDAVNFDSKYVKAMESVFGHLVICKDSTIAKKCAFVLGMNAVTLDGDTYNPGGTISGGTRKKAGEFLKACQDLKKSRELVVQLRRNIQNWEGQIKRLRKFEPLLRKVKEAEKQLADKQELLTLTTRQTLIADLNTLNEPFATLTAKLNDLKNQIQHLKGEESQLVQKQKSAKELAERSTRQVQAELNLWKKKRQMAKDAQGNMRMRCQDIESDFKAKEAYLKTLVQEINEAKKLVELKEEELVLKAEKVKEDLKAVDEALMSLQAKLDHHDAMEVEIDKIGTEMNSKDGFVHKLELTMMKRQSKLKDSQAHVQTYTDRVAEILREIPELENSQGEPVSRSKLELMRKDLETYKTKLEEIRLRLNRKAAAALPETERRLQEYKSNVEGMRQNRTYLEKILIVLDARKNDLIRVAYERVNDEFGQMMQVLLPGSFAELVPVNRNKLEDGLSIRVKLGEVWKDSLSELSGGQRSLVALALVLAMCVYNPVPFYILDEVDAALDLNHTANIGYLFQHKFPNVQFICVSLKDGLYKHANVLFTTYFETNTSKVRRSAKQSAQR